MDVMSSVGEHTKPEFIAINPQHCVPTIVDDGFVLWESRAIMMYLANKLSSNLYPTDIKQKAIDDRLLQFDLGNLYPTRVEYFFPSIMGKRPADEQNYKYFKESLNYLNGFLSNQSYVAGHRMTITDFSIFAGLTFIEVIGDYDFSEWSFVFEWMNKLKTELPYTEYHNEINDIPLRNFRDDLISEKS